MCRSWGNVFILSCVLGSVLCAMGGFADVLVITRDDVAPYTALRAALIAAGFPEEETITNYNARTQTPTLSELQNYDAVLHWSNDVVSDSALLGDRLADYVDGGGGVVLMVFAVGSWSGESLAGRWLSGGYDPMITNDQVNGVNFSLGTVAQPAHPVMTGVSSFSITGNYVGNGTPAGTVIASYNSSPVYPMAIERTGKNGRIVSLNWYPGSVYSEEGVSLVVNSLAYVSRSPLLVGPSTTFRSGGSIGSTLTPTAQVYTLRNTAASGSINWTVSGPAWLQLSTSGGSLAAGSSTTVTATVNQSYNTTPMVYSDELVFTDTTHGRTVSPPCQLTVTSFLGITPTTESLAYGNEGGTFSLARGNTYQLTNTSSAASSWSASSPPWLNISPSSGNLNAGQSVTLTISVNQAAAGGYPVGRHAGVISFTDATNGTTETRDAPLVVRGTTLYVNGALSTGANNGSSWANAFHGTHCLQNAIDAATANWAQVWVAQGTYVENIVMKEGVALYGGLLAGDTSLNQQNPTGHAVVIDGGNTESVVKFGTDAYYASIDGFTLIHGNGLSGGGGVRCEGTSTTCVIRQCTIVNNTATAYGSGISLLGAASPLIEKCDIQGNIQAPLGRAFGGGISCQGASNATIVDCILAGNTGRYGGGLGCVQSSPTVINCVISGNSAITEEGSPVPNGCGGGGVFAHDHSSPVFFNCIISGNLARNWDAGAVYCQNSSSPSFTNCNISSNWCWHTDGSDRRGGVVMWSECDPSFTNCIFEGNKRIALWEGEVNSDAAVTYSLFFGNTVADFSDEATTYYAGGDVINANVVGAANNLSGNPNPLYSAAITGVWTAVPVYASSTNTTRLTAAAGSFTAGALVGRLINADTTQTRQAIIVANTDSQIDVRTDITSATGLMGYADNGDAFSVLNYRLQGSSPAVNAGDPAGVPPAQAYDLLRTPRPQGSRVDIGPYEYDNTPPPSAPVLTSIENDTGTSASDLITNDQYLVYHGTGEKGATVGAEAIYNGGDPFMIWLESPSFPHVVVNDAGTWTFDNSNSFAAEGTWQIRWVMKDAAGNESPYSAWYTLIIDTTPPAAPSFTGPVTPTNNPKPTWTWTSGTGGSGTYQWKLDGGTVWTTTTTAAYTPDSNLPEGTHTLTVQECDIAGNWSVDSFFDVFVDLTPPNPPAVTGPSLTNNTRPTWSWSSGGGGGTGSYRYKLDGAPSWTPTATTTYTPELALSETTHSLVVQEQDNVGNWSDDGVHAITIDITSPSVLSLTGPTPTATRSGLVTYDVTFSEVVTGFSQPSDIQVDPEGTSAAPGGIAISGVGAGPYTVTLSGITGNGTLRIKVNNTAAVDAAGNGNISSGFSSRVSVDNTRPTIQSITRLNPAGAVTTLNTLTWKVTFYEAVQGIGPEDFIPQIVSGALTGADTFAVSASSGTSVDVTAGPMTGSGTVRLAVSGFLTTISDLVGNNMNSDFLTGDTYTVDQSGPVVEAVSNYATPDTTPQLGGNVDDDESGVASVSVRVYNAGLTYNETFAATVTPLNGKECTWSAGVTPALPEGSYSVVVTGTDVAGNTGPAMTFTLSVDTSVPTTTVNDLETADATPLLTGTATAQAPRTITRVDVSVAGVTRQAQLQGSGSIRAWSLTIPDNGALTDGTYTVTAEATNDLSRKGSGEPGTLTVDTTAPIIGYTPLATNAELVTLSGTVTESRGLPAMTVTVNGVLYGVAPVLISGADYSWTLEIGTLPEGTYPVSIEAEDALSNTRQADYPSGLVVDRTVPTGTVVIAAGATYTNTAAVVLTLTGVDGLSGVAWMRFSANNVLWEPADWVNAPAFSTPYSGFVLSPGEGERAVYVQLRDAAGNVSTAPITDTILVDLTEPEITDIAASPAQAKEGEAVTLTFAVSEVLQNPPEVTVNGRPAQQVEEKADAYAYTYVVTDDDPAGGALVEVTAEDLAGNLAVAQTTSALEILRDEPSLPLGWLPLALGLPLAGLGLLRRRPRR